MKNYFFAIIVSALSLAYGGDYGISLRDAGNAMKEKNYAVAETKYGEAIVAAKDSKQKCDAVLGKYKAMRRQGKQKIKESESFVTEALEDEMLKSPEVRFILNTVAYDFLWTPRFEYSLELLKQAQAVPCPESSNTYFRTYFYMAHAFNRKKQIEAAIEALDAVFAAKGVHPSNLFDAHFFSGQLHEKLGKKDDALKHYKKSLEAGKRVKFKIDLSRAEKAIERLTK